SGLAELNIRPGRLDDVRQVDGQPSVGADTYKERTATVVVLPRAVRAVVGLTRKAPAMHGIRLDVTDDQGREVTSSLAALAEAGAIGLFLSIAVLFFFPRHWPSTLMVPLAIPICFLMPLGFRPFAGVARNRLATGAR